MRIRLLAIVPLFALAATACGSSGGSADDEAATSSDAAVPTTEMSSAEPVATDEDGPSGAGGDDDEEFCGAAQDLIEAFFDETAYEPESVELFDALQSSAPDDIADDIDTFVEGNKTIIEQLSEIDESDPGAPDPLAEMDDDPAFDEADSRTFEYVSVSCDLEDPGGTGEDESPDGPDEDSGIDIDIDEDEIDPSVISNDGVKQHFVDDPATADLLAKVTTYGVSFERDITLGGDFIGDEAEEICTTALDYALAIDDEATVRIGTGDTFDEAFEETLIFEGDSGGCSAA